MRSIKAAAMSSTRRELMKLAAAGLAALATPAATSAGPAVPPLLTEFVYEAVVEIESVVEIGPSSHGIRRYIPIKGGTFSGPRIQGIVLPGGADWQTERPDGVTEVDALYSMKTDDGAVIIVRNRGLIAGPYFKTIPQFEAPRGTYDWLNKAVFAGSVAGVRPGAVVVRVFRVV